MGGLGFPQRKLTHCAILIQVKATVSIGMTSHRRRRLHVVSSVYQFSLPPRVKSGFATMTRFALSTVIAFVFVALAPELPAIATGDLFQQAVNYVFTGRLDPSDGPQIVDRDSCIVVVPEPKFNRYARYYLSRFKMDTARISKIYAGAQTLYELEVEGDDIIFEYLKADRTTVDYGFTSAQIPLPGEIGPTKKALALISSQFCRLDKPKTPF